jgi:hypothetical protein
MKWKDFKQSVELQGITDDMEIDYINTDMHKVTFEICVKYNSCHIE